MLVHFVYKRGPNRRFYIISLLILIFLYRYCYSFSIYRIRYMYNVILKTSTLSFNFTYQDPLVRFVANSQRSILIIHKSPRNVSLIKSKEPFNQADLLLDQLSKIRIYKCYPLIIRPAGRNNYKPKTRVAKTHPSSLVTTVDNQTSREKWFLPPLPESKKRVAWSSDEGTR